MSVSYTHLAFPEPVFDGEFKIFEQRAIGQNQNHLKMLVEPKNGGPLLDAIAFSIDTRYYPCLLYTSRCV